MVNKKRRNLDYMQLKFASFIYLVLMLTIGFIINNFKGYIKDYNPNNLLYIQLVNYSMPLVKTSSIDEESLSEIQAILGQQAIKIIELTLNDPINLMRREIAFLKTLDFNNEDMDLPSISNNVPQFSFDESMVKRTIESPSELRESQNQTLNTPDSQNKSINVTNPSIKKTLDKSKPEVLIYHTHTTESFSPFGNYINDPSKNITSVGEIITEELEKNYGISVVHDKTVHNSSMVKAYERSAATLNKYLKQYGSFKLIIDLHRDGGPSKATSTTRLNNEDLAKIMFVLAKKSPYFNQNQAVTTKLQDISDKIFPGFCRDVTHYKENGYYNQNKSPNTVLIELGSEKNTLTEAQSSGKYLARIIAEYINSN